MSAQFRTEWSKMVDKYARTFGVDPSLVKAASILNKLLGFYEDSVWCPSRPDLPVWGMGSNSEDWEDGPDRPRNLRGLSDNAAIQQAARWLMGKNPEDKPPESPHKSACAPPADSPRTDR